jgi:sorting nexin-13
MLPIFTVQILWPDGIFMTKHPSRKPAEPSPGAQNDGKTNYLTEEQRLEAAHRAEFVRELIIGEVCTCLVAFAFIFVNVSRDIMLFCQTRCL